ncbi:MAG: alanine--tRNA ligase [Chlamydiia bacterium]|nr:alanine--tRNA ligase [Chlamydiia bacterium]
MLTQKIRREFLDYFKKQGHSVIASSPVVPFDDPTLLFTNAGMNQFKDVFLGETQRDYNRAATSQKCVRVGGKHNDLDNVGHTNRHLTFFEMLGNFSFGDYFKEEAIKFAWEVSTKIFKLDPDRIWPSVFKDDEEAFNLWQAYVPKERITRFGEEDNFWSMGETGPCGPCTELYYDRGEKLSSAKNPAEDPEGKRFLEFWNLVFMQFNKDKNGQMKPLPKPSIDTGAGIERVVSLIMGVDSVFETDVLRGLIAKVEEIFEVPYVEDNEKGAPFRVIADHMRTLSFAIADGVQPSNVDRGYVLRKVLRRAVRYGRMLGAKEPFLAKLLPELIRSMGTDFPELKQSEKRIEEILTLEEEAFLRTLRRGGNLLNQVLEDSKASGVISGDEAFKLKDTYGLPIEEILLIAKDSHLKVDMDRFRALEEEAKEKSRAVHKGASQMASENRFEGFVKENGETCFLGYETLEAEGKVLALFKEGEQVEVLKSGESGSIVLNQTPFYAEMGGQVGDTGVLESEGLSFHVGDTKAPYKGVIVHFGSLESGELKIGDKVKAQVNPKRRERIAANHSATHLLHWALRKVLGEHVKQAGSVVDPERLRFDFSHHKAVTAEEIQAIEDLVNDKIRKTFKVQSYELPYEEASKREDIIQFFGEKYGSKVRVIDVEASKELCGGTHIDDLGKIGLFRIAKEGSVAAGVRRIEAVTGKEAEAQHRKSDQLLEEIALRLKTNPEKAISRIEKLLEDHKSLSDHLNELKQKELKTLSGMLLKDRESMKAFSAILKTVEVDPASLKELGDEIMAALNPGVLVMVNRSPEKCALVIRVSDSLTKNGIDAGKMVKELAPFIKGSGGGRPQMAQAGGEDPEGAEKLLEAARNLLLGHAG